MSKKQEKIFVIAMAILVIVGFIYIQNTETLFTKVVGEFSAVDWDEVRERDMVKNSIPITLLEKTDGKCKVDAKRFDVIIDHNYFVQGKDLAKELSFDRENETLLLPCNLLEGEKSRLNVWYVVEESTNHSKEYEYFLTPWEETPKLQE